MTFFEAAVAVLREAGRPLHFKKITEQAVKRELLSHVGKSPEDTMSARLTQEAAKPDGKSFVEQVRPGIFGLRAGSDADHAVETISLRHQSDAPEPEAVVDDAESDGALEPVEAPSVVRVDEENRRRGRRRQRRKGGKDARDGGTRDSGTRDADAGDNDDSKRDGRRGDDAEASDEKPRRERKSDRKRRGDDDDDRPRRKRGGRRGGKERAPVAADAPPQSDDDLSDVAAAAVAILERAKGRSYSASKVATELSRRDVGALGKLGAAALRNVLNEANATRARQGRPPVFEETKPNFWTLATASGSSLARSYADLDRWQSGHRVALTESLAERLGDLDEEALGSIVTLLLDRTGHTDLKAHDGEPMTLSARTPAGLVRATIAIRVFNDDDAVSADQIAAFRGSLHTFGASAGVMFGLNGFADDAADQADAPNVAPIELLDAEAMAALLVRAGVGVARFRVDVSCLDEAFFREITKD